MAGYGIAEACAEQVAKKVRVALVEFNEVAKRQLAMAIGRYYASYSPKIYNRTHLFPDTPSADPISGGTFHMTGRIYLDTGAGSYEKDPVGLDGVRHYARPWTLEEALTAADSGTHGGRVGGAPSIWHEPISDLQSTFDSMIASAIG